MPTFILVVYIPCFLKIRPMLWNRNSIKYILVFTRQYGHRLLRPYEILIYYDDYSDYIINRPPCARGGRAHSAGFIHFNRISITVNHYVVGGGFPDRQQLRAVIDIGYSGLIGIICAVQHQRCWVTARPPQAPGRAINYKVFSKDNIKFL